MQPERIIIFDTTLRDGEQCPGASMNNKEKLEIARQLSLLKVDVIEAGFPVASPGDFESVKQIASEIRGSSVAGLARALNKDVEACARALEKAESPRIHIFLSTSKLHRDHKLNMDKGQIIKMATDAIEFGRKYCDDIEFSPEDASRTEPDFLAEVVEAVIAAGAKTVNIPDTVGYSVPEQFGALIHSLKENVPNIDDAVISVHCHNDLGMAVANSLAAVKAGARQVECTINGIGERAGNAAMEEIVMALKTRKDFFGYDTRIDTSHIIACSRLVSSLTGFFVQRNKAIVGKNAFAHESGVHQDGYLKKKDTYEIMDPRDIGLDSAELVLGKHSGRNALNKKIESMGYKLTVEEMDRVFSEFKVLADEKKDVYDEDILAVIQKQVTTDDSLNTYVLEKIQCGFETGVMPEATVQLKSRDGQTHTATAQGDGPIDAIYNAMDKITGLTCKLLDYQVMSKTKGKDAQGEVSVRVLSENREVLGKGTGVNTVEASGVAYVNAINKLLLKSKSGPVDGNEIQGP
ncbi:2-Isopropylmalate synthase [Nitrospina gracilis 3/211]|uniref:2-isopropylmalate synthase n=1 Tax=Nitrospina gracilis (strain 3/211) TaxID=1266370 RepID=M1YL70_NITG3|nr:MULTISPECIES: 2-isopropylmalate synthase [Nitrospina]MCF8724073.1 2-isopropylmalate synthase [Nitrospina sp. Nb-3]CCQ91206.1 2-Isopropylmalate synthase [Nitrospina gracilis 3/211]